VHSTLASVRFHVKAVVSGVSPETTAADETQSYALALSLRLLRPEERECRSAI
jgi:hypothetical protein